MTEIPKAYIDLVETKLSFAHLVTLMPDGGPQVTPVWIDWDGEYVLVNSARGRVKDRNMERDPRVALSLLDPENPYRWLSIRGRVAEITEEGSDAHIDKMAMKYLGKEKYPARKQGEVRVIYKIRPEKVSASG